MSKCIETPLIAVQDRAPLMVDYLCNLKSIHMP